MSSEKTDKKKDKSLEKAVFEMYKGRERLIIIGLTGRTGSGCSTVAETLEKSHISELDLKQCKEYDYSNVEERKNRIVYEYMKEKGKWVGFTTIEVSSIILASALELGKESIIDYINKITFEEKANRLNIGDKAKVLEAVEQINYMFEECKKYPLKNIEIDKINIEAYYKFYIETIKKYKIRFKNILEEFTCYEIKSEKMKGKQISQFHLYTYLLQQMGNNIRCSGNPFDNHFEENKYRDFVERIDNVIKIINKRDEDKQDKVSRICIDAIRNPYEALYFKDKYRAFYLMAVSTEDSDRRGRLRELNTEELTNLDKIEYAEKMEKPEDVFYHQNIQGCIEIADLHIYNPDVYNGKYYKLTEQLLKYVSLILHPGLITPTNIERCMQLAYNTKFNSGCLSRQVGAVVTREDYSIQSVGWNDVPKGQVSCNLRDIHGFCKNKDRESYSKYEMEDEDFAKVMKKLDECTEGKTYGRCMSYCFKDVYNGIKDDKNQVYTRALHAEENAFLQISKYGGTYVKGGCLFTTASPCELCAKKAYQLGIKYIYYIDPYPGISQKHILTFGENDNPEMKLFYGAIGQAYLDFYEPRIAIKDELEMLTGVNIKKTIKEKDKINSLEYDDISYENVYIDLKFDGGRNNIESRRKVSAVIKKEGIDRISKKLIWTGSSYDSSCIIENESDSDITLEETNNKSLYAYNILLGTKRKVGDRLNYKILTKVKDEKQVMEPYLAHMVKNDTDKLTIKVIAPKDTITNVVATEYADLEMKTKIKEVKPKCRKNRIKKTEVYWCDISNANVNYTYAIEWKFK